MAKRQLPKRRARAVHSYQRRPHQPNLKPLDPLPYPWLPADDEANLHAGVYVPTPEQLQAEVAQLRERLERHPRNLDDFQNALCRTPVRKRAFD